jgi:hypothetical protein
MKAAIAAFIVASVSSALCATDAMARDKAWKCSAPGLKEGKYSGGETAYIHLSAFPAGADYSLTRKYKKSVTGFTSNGTRFVCRFS